MGHADHQLLFAAAHVEAGADHPHLGVAGLYPQWPLFVGGDFDVQLALVQMISRW